jgi:hypothetical protein
MISITYYENGVAHLDYVSSSLSIAELSQTYGTYGDDWHFN